MADTVGERISEIIKLRKLSQKEVASELGIPASSLNNYIKGKTHPSVDFIITFCNTYNVSADFLLYGTGPTDRATQDLIKVFPTTSSEEDIGSNRGLASGATQATRVGSIFCQIGFCDGQHH